MATAVPTNPDIECCICTETFTITKILSCGHSFCRDCLERWIGGRNRIFPCPHCKQEIKIPRGGVDSFTTNVSLQTLVNSPKTADISTSQPSTSLNLKHHCPNHSKREVEYYCQTCKLGLCYKCILKDHRDHEYSDIESNSTKEKVVQELSKSEQFVKNKIKELNKALVTLFETSEKLKSLCDKSCTKISEKTEKIICELKEKCEERQQGIRDQFDKNESKLTETRQQVITQITNINTDLDASRPTSTEKPSFTLIYSLNKLQKLQKLCENMKTDIPPVTYVEWREGSVNVCDILGSTVTKPLYQSSKGSEPISTVTKRLYQSSEGSGPISTVTKPLYQFRKGSGPTSTVTKPLYQSSEGSGPISTVTEPLYQSSVGSGPISTVTKPVYQSSEGSGPISTVTKTLYQSSEGSGPISTVTKSLYQSSESSGPISTVTKSLYQSSESSGPISTVTKSLYQSSEGSVPISTVTKPLYQSSESSGPISTVTKPPYQSSEGSVPISTVTKPLYQSSEGSGPISTVNKSLYQSSESSVPISTVTKPLYQSSEGSGHIPTVTKPLYQSSEGSVPISTVTKQLYQSSESSVFRFNYKDIKGDDVYYNSIDKYRSRDVIWSCSVMNDSYYRCLYIDIKLLEEDNPRVKSCTIKYTVTLVNEDKNKNVISGTRTERFIPDDYVGSVTILPCDKLTDSSAGFIDNEGQFLVKFDILQDI